MARHLLLAVCAALSGCAAAGTRPLVEQRATAFPAGADGSHCQRIPSLVTTKDGSLLLACESRRVSWRDKSPTDVVVRRSADNGRTWSATQVVLPGGDDAQMDPCLLVDRLTGRVFLFASRWPAKDHSSLANTAWMTTSDDNGLTWSKPADVSATLFPPGSRVHGFGPGAGIQLSAATAKPGRLVVPVRLRRDGAVGNCSLYSDDHGATWTTGASTARAGEFQIAEGPGGLVSNQRDDVRRLQSTSADCGVSWTEPAVHPDLPSITSGCQSSVLGVGNVLLYTGPAGVDAGGDYDNRGRLTLRRSLDGGKTWPESVQLDDRAAGYSCLARLGDGRVAVVFETADTPAFIHHGERLRWMRMDVLVLSASVTDPSKPLADKR